VASLVFSDFGVSADVGSAPSVLGVEIVGVVGLVEARVELVVGLDSVLPDMPSVQAFRTPKTKVIPIIQMMTCFIRAMAGLLSQKGKIRKFSASMSETFRDKGRKNG
jgi:hypothetical protein